MALSRSGYLAVKKETTTALAVKPTNFLRFKDGDMFLKKEVIANNPIQNNRWGALNAVAWKETTEWSYNFDFDFNESVHIIWPALWSITSTDVWTPTTLAYQHVINVTNPYSFSLEQLKWDGTDTTNNRQNYQVDRAFWTLVDSFSISWSDWILNLEAWLKSHGIFEKSSFIVNATAWSSVAIKLISVEGLVATSDTVNIWDNTPISEQKPIAAISIPNSTITIATLANSYAVAKNAKVELVPQTPTYAIPAKVASFIHCRFQFGADLTAAASAAFENVEDWSFMFENNLEERFGSLRTSPSVIAPKAPKATLKYTKYFTDVRDRDTYLNIAKTAIILTINNNELIAPTDTSNKTYQCKIEMSDVRLTSYEVPTWTDELYAATVEAECYYDQTDWRALRITFVNRNAWTVYA